MQGLYKINGLDAYTTYGLVFGPGVYNELLKLPKRKEGYAYSWPDENGTERDVSQVYYESRVLNLPITILASSESQFYSRYYALTQFLLTSGYFDFDVVQMNRRFKLLYQDMTNFDKLTQIKGSTDIGCEFTLQLIDDFPTSNTPIPA